VERTEKHSFSAHRAAKPLKTGAQNIYELNTGERIVHDPVASRYQQPPATAGGSDPLAAQHRAAKPLKNQHRAAKPLKTRELNI